MYGCKDATTAAPPTDSDLCVRGTDTLPVYESTSAGDIFIAGISAVLHGIRIDSDDETKLSGGRRVLYDCEIDFDTFLQYTSANLLRLVNCDLEFADALTKIALTIGETTFEMIGGLFSGTAPNSAFGSHRAQTYCYGVDMSLVTNIIVTQNSTMGGPNTFKNCKIAAGVTKFSGISTNAEAIVEFIGCSDETGLGSGESVRAYSKENGRGTVLDEAVIVRTGGVSDGVAGWSFSLLPKASSTKEGSESIVTPWFGGIVEGDATTSKDFTVYISNNSGSDLTDADVWVDFLYPSEGGTTQHDNDVSSRTSIDASPGTIADDTASDWSTGAGGKNAQKIIISKTPDFTGPVYARVHFAQAGTNTLYVDPKVYVTDT